MSVTRSLSQEKRGKRLTGYEFSWCGIKPWERLKWSRPGKQYGRPTSAGPPHEGVSQSPAPARAPPGGARAPGPSGALGESAGGTTDTENAPKQQFSPSTWGPAKMSREPPITGQGHQSSEARRSRSEHSKGHLPELNKWR